MKGVGAQNVVTVTREVHVRATPSVVWDVMADPSAQEILDPRCGVSGVTGDWRRPWSEFDVTVHGMTVHYVVTEAEPGVLWTAHVEHHGRHAGVQRGELTEVGAGTLLRWTVTFHGNALSRWSARRSCERQLPQWLEAVRRESVLRAHGAKIRGVRVPRPRSALSPAPYGSSGR